jgi:ParB family transcriptional regulator, chromosome partitioning protein
MGSSTCRDPWPGIRDPWSPWSNPRMAKKKTVKRRKKVAPKSIGLGPSDVTAPDDAEITRLKGQVESDGGTLLTAYREPIGGTTVLLAALPIDRVEPTPFQRDPSEPHVKRLMNVIETLGRFLDPIIAIRENDGYWTPNGNHRLQALRKIGAQTVIALLLPDPEVAFKILALNTEKAHNLKEKSLETIRMERALAERSGSRLEREFAFEFDQPAFLTLGAAYDKRPRLSGGAYQSVLRRIEDFLDERLTKALAERERRASKLLAIDDEVGRIVQKLKGRGFTSPYLRPFVVARINPIRFSTSTEFDVDDVLDRMLRAATKFNVEKIKQEDVVRAGGAPEEEE